MNLRTFDKLSKRDFENGAVTDSIRRVFKALNEYDKYNRLRNDLDAYLHYMYLWAIENEPKPDPKDFGLD